MFNYTSGKLKGKKNTLITLDSSLYSGYMELINIMNHVEFIYSLNIEVIP